MNACYLDIKWALRSIRNQRPSVVGCVGSIRPPPRQQMVRRIADLHFPNPFAAFPNRFQGGQVAAVAEVPGGGAQSTLLQIVPGVAGADSDELQHTRIAVAVDHATRAAVANPFR